MSSTSLSPRKVIVTAYRVGQRALPTYAHRFSPKKFTQPQLFACLAIKTFFKQDYQRTEAMLRDWPGLCEAIGMKAVPDHSTLHKAARRLLRCQPSDAMLSATVRLMMGRRKCVKLAAMDSTGLESGQISPYYVKRYTNRPAEELYHTADDPYELNNVTDAPQHAELKAQLRAELDRWMKNQGDPGAAQDTLEAIQAAIQGKHLYYPPDSP